VEAPVPERRQFGRYEVLFPIARGGMAEVYAARARGEAGFQKLVALKRMRPEMAEDARFATMFLDEGRMAANIESPNVVATLDLGRADDNSLFLVMELVRGASLATLLTEMSLRHTTIDIAVAVEIIAQAAAGLHDAHEAIAPGGEPLGIVHRDCSPHNILVDVRGAVKISDFGIAKALERQTKSQAGEMKGKLRYLSPEQARGLPVDRRTDVFILGIVAWELIAQRRLFDGASAVEVLHRVTTMPIPRLDEVRPDAPAHVADAVAQALVRAPDERFSTASAFGNALRSAAGVRATRAQIGELVRDHGGATLREIERGLRETFGPASTSAPPSAPEYPIPLTAKRSRPEPLEDDAIATPPATLPDPDGTSDAPIPLSSVIRPSAPSAESLRGQTVPMDALELAGLGHLARAPSAPGPDTVHDADVDAAELERLRHPSPQPAGIVAKLPGLRDDPTEPEVRSELSRKRRGVSGSIAPPSVDAGLDELPMKGSGALRWALIALAIVLACGAGGAAAWFIRARRRAPPAPPPAPSVAPTTSSPTPPLPPSAPAAPPPTAPPDDEPAGPGASAPPSTPPPPRATDVREALDRAGRGLPVRRVRRRARPHGTAPPRVGGSAPPEGDRQAAFEEIPW